MAQKYCSVCDKAANKHCSACKRISYCSAFCQRADWGNHRIQCAALTLGLIAVPENICISFMHVKTAIMSFNIGVPCLGIATMDLTTSMFDSIATADPTDSRLMPIPGQWHVIPKNKIDEFQKHAGLSVNLGPIVHEMVVSDKGIRNLIMIVLQDKSETIARFFPVVAFQHELNMYRERDKNMSPTDIYSMD